MAREGAVLVGPDPAEFRRLNLRVFQTEYSKKFYDDFLASGEFSRLALVEGEAVGGVGVRIQENLSELCFEGVILVIGVLPEFRRRGIASRLLHHVVDAAERHDSVSRLRLRVHRDNAPALRLYEMVGFERLWFDRKADEWILTRDTIGWIG